MLAVIVLGGMLLYRPNNMVRSYMDDPRPPVLARDEEGVGLSKEGSRTDIKLISIGEPSLERGYISDVV